LIAEAAMPTLTAIAKPRIVSFGLTWRESVIPTPTTGKDSPTNAATNIPAWSRSAIRSAATPARAIRLDIGGDRGDVVSPSTFM